MLAWLIRWSLEHRAAVLVVTLALCGFGAWTYSQQRIDAYPDISPQVVMVLTTFPGRAPEEIERQVTIPIELAMGSVPQLESIRSRSIFGLSVVECMFAEGVEPYFARQRVQERLSGVVLPDGASSELGPLATAYGEIYRYYLRSAGTQDTMALRTLNDWVVVPRLRRLAGVAEVVNFGGLAKQYTLMLDPAQLERFGLTLADVIQAVQTNNANAGGSVLERGSMSFVIRGRGSFQNVEDIESTVINSLEGTPVYVRDVATVRLDAMVPSGTFAINDLDDAVEGIVLLRRGENPSRVLQRVDEEVASLNRDPALAGATIEPFYNRTFLVESTLETVAHSVGLGIALVVAVLLAFLGSPAMAALVVLTIPFSLLFALVLMYFTDIPIGLLSIGAIDFGILVDGAVIMADNIARHLSRTEEKGPDAAWRTILAAAIEVERPIFFSMLMIIGAYLPLLTLTRIEGLLFRPMALTVTFALIGAVLFSLLALPALASYLLRRGYTDWENPLLTWVRPHYARLLARMLQGRWLVLGVATVLLVAVGWFVAGDLGTEFLPYLDEGVIWVRANFPEGTSLRQSAAFGKRIRGIIREFPEVQTVTAQAGRNDSGTDPFPPSRLELMVVPRPREQWSFASKQELLAALGARLRSEFPTTRFNFTQPIIDSVTEDTNGTSANLAIEFAGADTEVLWQLARETRDLLRQVPGAIDVNIEQEGPQPQLIVEPDRSLCARYDVNIDDVNQLINTALGGQPIGTLYEGDRRFDVVARFDRDLLHSREAIERLPVFTRAGVPIPLAQVARFDLVDGQTIIARDSPRRRVTVRSDIVGRDQGGFVKDAQRRFTETIQVPDGYRVRWIGMFENLQRASSHFALVIPATVAFIYLVLVATFRSQRDAMIVLLSVPFAFVGGAIALAARGMNLNVSSAVGFAALFGVSIMNGVVLVEWINALRERGEPLERAIISGSLDRLRSILIASLVAILGLLPASVATGLGSDVQRPLATVIVWGLVSSTLLTLFGLPVLYRLFASPDPKPAL